MVANCVTGRWTNGINARYYGANPTRLDLAEFAPIAATIVGVYDSSANDATLLESKSLAREAKGAPLQKDIAKQAAKYIKALFIKDIQGPQRAITQAPVQQ